MIILKSNKDKDCYFAMCDECYETLKNAIGKEEYEGFEWDL
jgi:hypothetical protein